MLDVEASLEAAFEEDVLEGLARPQKTIPSRWLYDERGSELFEEITQLPEYYLTRTETAILTEHADDVARAAGPGATLVEYGSGAAIKTRLLLDAFKSLRAYVPIDVSASFLAQSADALRSQYPDLEVIPIIGDFLQPIAFGKALDADGTRVGFFPGSTIGNLSDGEIAALLGRARADLGAEALFVLGADLRKAPSILIDAYDDKAGVTAAFNLNLLERINRELNADFDLSAFKHEARWNDAASRIEMHVVSRADQTVRVGERAFSFAEGESVHTENSRKFSLDAVAALCRTAGWSLAEAWSDADDLFSVMMLKAT